MYKQKKRPCYSTGTNFTVNAWVQFAELYKSLDKDIRIQQDLTPMQDGSVRKFDHYISYWTPHFFPCCEGYRPWISAALFPRSNQFGIQ